MTPSADGSAAAAAARASMQATLKVYSTRNGVPQSRMGGAGGDLMDPGEGSFRRENRWPALRERELQAGVRRNRPEAHPAALRVRLSQAQPGPRDRTGR